MSSTSSAGRGGMISVEEADARVRAAIHATLEGAKAIGRQEIEAAIIRTHKGIAETVRGLAPQLAGLDATQALMTAAHAIEQAKPSPP